MARSDRFPWVAAVLTAIGVAVLVGLGTWQLRRLAWKEDLIARAAAAERAPVAPLRNVLPEPRNVEFRRVAADCVGLASARFVELQSIEGGQPGVRLISLCRPVEGGRPLLIDRGFVAETVSARPSEAVSETPVRVTAQLRANPPVNGMAPAPDGRRFYARDAAAMAQALGAGGEVEPLTLFALTSSNPDWAALRPSAPPAAFSNNHLGYAMTWFGLAAALAGVFLAFLARRRRA